MVCTLPSAASRLGSLYARIAGAPSGAPVPAVALGGGRGTDAWFLLPLLGAEEGRPLRQLAGAPEPEPAERIAFHVRLEDGGRAVQPPAPERAEARGGAASLGTAQEYAFRFSYDYPYPEAANAPSKLTATALRALTGESAVDAEGIAEPAPAKRYFPRPAFVRDQALTPAEKGIAAHLAMQLIDFRACTDLEGVRRELLRLHASRQLTDLELEAIEPEKLWSFFGSPIGRQALAGDGLRREFRFSVLAPAAELADGEQVLLQGVVVLFFDTPEGLVILDFKTDRNVMDPEAVRRYRAQMDAYSYALGRITGRPVARRMLFFLQTGRAVEL